MGGTTISPTAEATDFYDSKSPFLLPLLPNRNSKIPQDSYHLAYIIYFILGTGSLTPFSTFITAVDYFSYLYPDASVDRVFSVVYMISGLIALIYIVFYSHKSHSSVRINVGLGLFVVSLVVVPVIDVGYIKGRVGVYGGFYVTVAATAVAGIADSLVQAGVIGAAGEMPERYIQAVVAGTAGSGVLIAILRIITKAIYPQDGVGLRKSANLYFMVSILIMIICIVLHNIAHRLPIIQYYKELKIQALNNEKENKEAPSQSRLWDIVGIVKWYGLGVVILYAVTLAIFPGYITEDVHSEIFQDWYPIILIASCDVFDLIGKCLTSVYMVKNSKVAIGASFARLLFFPVYFGCLHGPMFLRTEIPVTIVTCLLGLTNGYLTSCLLMLGAKSVPLQHVETAGTVLILFLVVGLASGSVVSWFWVI